MKTTNYLWMAPLVGLLSLAGCSTTSENPPPAAATHAAGTQTSYYVSLDKKAPTVVGVGEQFTYELIATAQAEASDVQVVDVLPGGVTFVSSEPEATQDGPKLTWKFQGMSRSESKTIRVTVKADTEGQMVHCATASAIPQVCIATLVGRPQLAIRKTGPAAAQVGQQLTYEVVVQNVGNAPAREVVVTDTLPEGLSGSDGQKELTFPVGELGAGASKSISIPVKATKRGKVTNVAAAIASNSPKVSSEALTAINEAAIKLKLATKDKDLFINRAAMYDLEVSNTGDTGLSGVVLTDNAAPETLIAAAEGASVSGTVATWNIGALASGEKKNFALKIVSKVPGNFTDSATVTSTEGPTDSAKAATTWKGITGITLELLDETDPIQVGETTKFNIRVTNQGATIDVSQLKIVATLPPEVELVPNTLSDDGAVDGKTITWTVPTVAPKGSVVRSYIVKGVKAGDARSMVTITSSTSPNPIEQHESTTVY